MSGYFSFLGNDQAIPREEDEAHRQIRIEQSLFHLQGLASEFKNSRTLFRLHSVTINMSDSVDMGVYIRLVYYPSSISRTDTLCLRIS